MGATLDERRERAARALRDCRRLKLRQRPLGAPKLWYRMGVGDLERVEWPAWGPDSARAGAVAAEWLGGTGGLVARYVVGITDGYGRVVSMLGAKAWPEPGRRTVGLAWVATAPDFRGLGFGSALLWHWYVSELGDRGGVIVQVGPVRLGERRADHAAQVAFATRTLGDVAGHRLAGGTVFARCVPPAVGLPLLTDTVVALGGANAADAQPAILADALQDAGADGVPALEPYLRALRGGACAPAFADFKKYLIHEGRRVSVELYTHKRS